MVFVQFINALFAVITLGNASENFLGKIEKGGETVQWGKLFQMWEGLGVRVILDLPDAVESTLAKERTKTAKRMRP